MFFKPKFQKQLLNYFSYKIKTQAAKTACVFCNYPSIGCFLNLTSYQHIAGHFCRNIYTH
jgi:hypothetical protein